MKINWTKVFTVLKYAAAIITTVFGTIAVQDCTPEIF